MKETKTVNFPDILGSITRGTRANQDVVQCALAARPPQVHAGQQFELVVLLQNASDIEVDVTLQPILPERDHARRKQPFTTPSTRILCGLEAAQTGYVVLPVKVGLETQPGTGYSAEVELSVKCLKKSPQRIRAIEGGGTFALEDLPDDARIQIDTLRPLRFSAERTGRKQRLTVPFSVLPPARTSGKSEPQQAGWVSLWTMRDHNDDYTIAERVWDTAQRAMQNFTRGKLFMPLLKTTQERFQATQYPLLPPEAIFITKLLMLQLELGVAAPTAANPRPRWPRWFTQMCRILIREPALADQVEPLVTRLLYHDLVFDAVLFGFATVSTVTNEQFGSEAEIHDYAETLVEALTTGQPVDFSRAYLPLVMGGLIANARVTMPREQVRETVFILAKALEKRQPERHDDNRFIFELTVQIIDRALDSL